ncbi:MAG: AraC family transcriptional regulator, partial [Pseudomonas sp.]|nr:AraC family transcriptional regulator [Pseudomonas sp.]
MLHAPLTTLHVVSLILQRFAEQPELRPQLLAGSGIGAADLDNADARITRVQELQVCANALALRADLGLDLGRSLHVSSYGLLGYAALSAATFGDAWRLLLQYPALLGTYFRLDMQVEGELAWICASGYRDAEALEVFNVEMCLASLRLIGDELLRQPLSLEGAEFTYARPDYVTLYAQSFPCPLRFEAQRNAFAFPAALLERRLPLADSVTHGDMVERCRRLNAEFSSRQA